MKKNLKVAHVLLSLSTGGMEKVVVDIIKRFNGNIDSHVYCVGEEGEYAKDLKERGIEVSLVEKNKLPFNLAFSLAEVFKREKVDVVHSYSGIYRDATLAGMIANIPVIVHTDQGKFYPDRKWTGFNHWLFSHFRDRVVAVSEELKDFLGKRVHISPRKITRIYNAVDVSDHEIDIDPSQKKKDLGISLNAKVIGIVARLAPVKDHSTLFQALKKVRESYKNVKLLVIGDGPLRDALKETAREVGEEENIIFLGMRNDVKELLHIMDIVCLSSTSEGLSLTLAEAMASGKPVVATKVGGNSELVRDGITGFLVPPGNPEKMAEAIIKLLEDDDLRKSMGVEAKKRVQKNFDINGVVKEYEELYFSLAREKGIV